MSNEQPGPGRLTTLQATRLDYARYDLAAARATDLARLDAASLILLVERLKTRLDDMIGLVAETCDANPAGQPGLPHDHP
ncbi:hypothetical protein [Streptomyces sp. NPDC056188]|uniref:hypothetical protein n=1 Tax=Streptomyces sp. NPDC056188 TaxID=3345740 RepID=UPI0035DC3032